VAYLPRFVGYHFYFQATDIKLDDVPALLNFSIEAGNLLRPSKCAARQVSRPQSSIPASSFLQDLIKPTGQRHQLLSASICKLANPNEKKQEINATGEFVLHSARKSVVGQDRQPAPPRGRASY
jgi:hypothetical protein